MDNYVHPFILLSFYPFILLSFYPFYLHPFSSDLTPMIL